MKLTKDIEQLKNEFILLVSDTDSLHSLEVKEYDFLLKQIESKKSVIIFKNMVLKINQCKFALGYENAENLLAKIKGLKKCNHNNWHVDLRKCGCVTVTGKKYTLLKEHNLITEIKTKISGPADKVKVMFCMIHKHANETLTRQVWMRADSIEYNVDDKGNKSPKAIVEFVESFDEIPSGEGYLSRVVPIK